GGGGGGGVGGAGVRGAGLEGGRTAGWKEGAIYARGMSGTYEGKRGLVLGVANKRSIAWAIAKRLADAGAELAFTYQGERIEKSVRELAESVSSPLVTECDVRSDEDVGRVFREVAEAFDGGLDLL